MKLDKNILNEYGGLRLLQQHSTAEVTNKSWFATAEVTKKVMICNSRSYQKSHDL